MRLAAIVIVLAGCRIELDKPVYNDAGTAPGRTCQITTSAPCKLAEGYQSFSMIQTNIFKANCFGSSCHDDATKPGKVDLITANAYTALLGPGGNGVASMIDTSRKLVVPGSSAKSYLMLMVHAFKPADADPPGNPPPSDIGYMPQSGGVLCCQKLDAIDRWITAGAKND
jgi:hypothetical protein